VTTSDHKPVFAVFEVKLKLANVSAPPMLGSTTPRSASRPVVRKLNNDKANYHIKVSNISIRQGSHEIQSATAIVFRFTGDVVGEQLAAKSLDQHSSRSALNFQYIPPFPIKVVEPPQLKTKHLILSVWDKAPKAGGSFLGQCTLSLDELVESTTTTFQATLLCYAVPCGKITGNLELLTDRQLTGSFIQRFKKEVYVV